MKKVEGPDGRIYRSISALCKEYHISKQLFQQRINKGWPLMEALTKERKNFRCKDPDGREFPSIKVMLDFYGVKRKAFDDRIKNGMSLEEALRPSHHFHPVTYRNVLYKSMKDLCQDLSVDYQKFRDIYSNVCLKLPENQDNAAVDITLEQMYNPQLSMLEMVIQRYLNEHGIPYIHNKQFASIVSDHMVEDNDVGALRPDYVIESFKGKMLFIEADGGQHFRSDKKFFKSDEEFKDLIRRDQLKTKFIQTVLKCPLLRIRYDQGDIYSILDSFFDTPENYLTRFNPLLTNEEYYHKGNIYKYIPELEYDRKPSQGIAPENMRTDFNGRVFRTQRAMLRHYGLNRQVFYARIKSGMSLEESLIKPVPDRGVYDYKGQYFRNTKEMTDYYHVKESTYYNRLSYGYTQEEALNPKLNFKYTKNKKLLTE